MKKQFQIISIFLSLCNNYILTIEKEISNQVITLFFSDLNLPNKIDKNQAFALCNLINCKSLNLPYRFGIFATYNGYINITDENGEIKFPRKTIKNNLNLLITDEISPVFMLKNTIAYWEIPINNNAKMYKFERKKDKETELTYWDVKERNLPSNRRIPIHTIIILTDYRNILVPEGITITNPSAQLILPTLYIKNNINYAKNSLFAMTISPFFASIKKIFKERPTGYAVQII